MKEFWRFMRFLGIWVVILILIVCSVKLRAIATSDFTVDMLEKPDIVEEITSVDANFIDTESTQFVSPTVQINGDVNTDSKTEFDNQNVEIKDNVVSEKENVEPDSKPSDDTKQNSEQKQEPVTEETTKTDTVDESVTETKPEVTEPAKQPEPEKVPEEPVQEKENSIIEEMNRRGNIGRLRITSVGVDVALFKASIWDVNYAQKVVDNSDSAAIMYNATEYYGFVMIGDHRHQGFDRIKKSVPGSTTAVIDNGTNLKTYICTDKWIGYNGYKGTPGLHDRNGNLLYQVSGVDLCMYTCNIDGTITVTYWNAI